MIAEAFADPWFWRGVGACAELPETRYDDIDL
jgi:hypothetical protein